MLFIFKEENLLFVYEIVDLLILLLKLIAPFGKNPQDGFIFDPHEIFISNFSLTIGFVSIIFRYLSID